MGVESGVFNPSVFKHSDFFMAMRVLGRNTVSQSTDHHLVWSGCMCRTGQDGCNEIRLLSGASFTVNGLNVIFNGVW